MFSHKEFRSRSMFTDAQIEFLFQITKAAAVGIIPPVEARELITPALERIIKFRDKQSAEKLFIEISQTYKLPYTPIAEFDDGPGAA